MHKLADFSQFWLFLTQLPGTGLAFIAVADAIAVMPGGPFWAVLFFLMLLTLGLGSAFGTLEGFITPMFNLLGDKLPKPALTGLMSLVLAGLGMIFAQVMFKSPFSPKLSLSALVRIGLTFSTTTEQTHHYSLSDFSNSQLLAGFTVSDDSTQILTQWLGLQPSGMEKRPDGTSKFAFGLLRQSYW